MKCPKCGKGAKKVYKPEEVEKAYPNNIRMQVTMKREYICTDVPCSKTFQATMKQVMKAFRAKKEAEGLSTTDTINELTKGVVEMKERFSNDETGDNIEE